MLLRLPALMIDLASRLFFIEVKTLLMNLLKQFLKNISTVKKMVKKHFNKNLIMSKEEEYLFQPSNSCWICKKLIIHDDEKVRDHCHIASNFRGAAHWDCNINFQLTKKVPVIFHNLKNCDSHLIFSVLHKFNLKVSVIPNGLEKYMAFFLNKNLVFFDSMQFMSSSLNKVVKNLSLKILST